MEPVLAWISSVVVESVQLGKNVFTINVLLKILSNWMFAQLEQNILLKTVLQDLMVVAVLLSTI